MTQPATRRDLLRAFFATGLAAAPFGFAAPAPAQPLPATPACGADEAPTRAQTAGPYYLQGTPERANLRADAPGEGFTLVGFVLDRRCRPIPRAVVELWHADSRGDYDVRGYRLRGRLSADGEGRYAFETITPGLYPGRTRHFHAKAQPPGGRVLTTQLYFPDEPGNRSDGIFDQRLLMKVQAAADGKIGRFDFVLAG
jgi:protocatechuate 3,4-dioxygenase beta subunit